MELSLIKAITPWVLPPGANFVGVVLGLALLRRWRKTAWVLIGSSLTALYILSTYLVASALQGSLERYPVADPETLLAEKVQAIVVLGGGRYPVGPEFGAETVSVDSFSRLRYAAHLHRKTHLPILATGGAVHGESRPEAELAKIALETEFNVPVRWTETESRITAENAALSFKLLAQHGITKIALVTHASHMPRSVQVFERVGFDVTPAPTLLSTRGDGNYGLLSTVVPSARALNTTVVCLHEYLGMLWYAIRY